MRTTWPVLLVLSVPFAVSGQKPQTGKAQTSGPCSPAISGSGNTVIYKSCGGTPHSGKGTDLNEREKWLQMFPFGYAKFITNAMTGAVIPLQVENGGNQFAFGFQSVKVLVNNDHLVALQLPDLYRDGKIFLEHPQIGSDPRTMEAYGGGYGFRDQTGNGYWITGKILEYKASEILWIVGISKAPFKPSIHHGVAKLALPTPNQTILPPPTEPVKK
jgi:hypothetical protein